MAKTKKTKGGHEAVTETRIAHICDLMESLQWRRGKTGQDLAAKWELSLSRIEDLSAIAAKRVRAKLTDPDRVASKVSVVLDRVMDEALAQNDRRAAIEAAKTYAMIAGVQAPQKHEISGPDGSAIAVTTGVVMLPPEKNE